MTDISQPKTSPCIRNCCLNEDDICLGCFRSIEEIMQWAESTNQQRQFILDNCKKRELDYKKTHPEGW